MQLEEVSNILARIEYGDWTFSCRPGNGGGTELRVSFDDPEEGRQNGRWWVVSQHAVKSEVVTTALKAVLTAEEHEARERFRYRGVRIFGPHLDVDVLADQAKYLANLDIRQPA